MNQFKEIKVTDSFGGITEKIGSQWMLLAAENDGRVNMMTASWGGLGVLWHKPVSFTFFRPQRYTLELVNAADTLSMTFFDENYRSNLKFCGSNSGRDFDKVKECGFEILRENGTPYFAEANLAIICKKLYVQRLEASCFLDSSISPLYYPEGDYHYMFVSEIVKVLEK